MKADLYYTTELNGKDTEQVFQIRGADVQGIMDKAKVFQTKTGLSVEENKMYFIIPPFYPENRCKIL